MLCKFCGKELSDEAVFCSGCGKKLVMDDQEKLEGEENLEEVTRPIIEKESANTDEEKMGKIPSETADSNFKICKYCGSKIGSNNAFCTNCGKSFSVQTVQCKNCGAENQPDFMFCGKCGQRLYPVHPENQNAQSQFNASGQPCTTMDGISPKSRLTALMLGIFVGSFGAHNFYLGIISRGVAQAVISSIGLILYIVMRFFVGWPLFLVPTFGMFVWSCVEWIFIATGKGKDSQGLKVINWD